MWKEVTTYLCREVAVDRKIVPLERVPDHAGGNYSASLCGVHLIPQFLSGGGGPEAKREQIAAAMQARDLGSTAGDQAQTSSNRLVGLKLPTSGNFVRRRPPLVSNDDF